MARGRIKLWQLILAGPFLIWLGIHEYNRLDDLETHGGRIYVDKLTHFLYSIGGKNAVLVCIVGFGIFYIYLLYRWWRDQQWAERRLEEIDAANEPAPAPKPKRAPVEARPRVDADPFRAPPAAAPVVVAPVAKKIESPIVASDTDGPKFLT